MIAARLSLFVQPAVLRLAAFVGACSDTLSETLL